MADTDMATRLRDRRTSVWNEARTIAATAFVAGREFTGDEQTRWDILVAELDELDRRLTAVLHHDQARPTARCSYCRAQTCAARCPNCGGPQ